MPDYEYNSSKWKSWAPIACDQFTSQPEYWEEALKLAGDDMSALSLILPEAFLETEREAEYKKKISLAMSTVPGKLKEYKNMMVYLERRLPDGKVRRGIVGKVDLEQYDYSPSSSSGIRATEQTVVERIPPRVEVRRGASVELPHVMLFFDDRENSILSPLTNKINRLIPLYSFELMLGGGRVRGCGITGEDLDALVYRIAEYENSRRGGVVYAVGDGNHSLASAKAYYEELKARLGDDALAHPARYALVEAVNLHDTSIQFEPIYRLLKGCRARDLSFSGEGRQVTAVDAEGERTVYVPDSHPLTVGSLQNYIDAFTAEHPEVRCDYIHGEDALRSLAAAENSVGFLFEGIAKEKLFAYVESNGVLPRKTFSMGEAKSKRYYIEARKIIQ